MLLAFSGFALAQPCANIDPNANQALFDSVVISAATGATSDAQQAHEAALAVTKSRKQAIEGAVPLPYWAPGDLAFYEAVVASMLAGAGQNGNVRAPKTLATDIERLAWAAVQNRKQAIFQVCRPPLPQ